MQTRTRIPRRAYRHVFIVQNRTYWQVCPFTYDQDQDLVLSFDFGVVNLVRSVGGEAHYIDHIVDSDLLESYNYKVYDFFNSWYLDPDGQNIFSYRGIDIGSALRIEIFNDITFFVRIFVNLHELKKSIPFAKMFTGLDDPVAKEVIKLLKISSTSWSRCTEDAPVEYYFPIFQWMDEKLHPERLRYKLKVYGFRILDKLVGLYDGFKNCIEAKKYVYIHRYHPTKDIISELQKTGVFQMVREDFISIKDMLSGIHLPIYFSNCDAHHEDKARRILFRFQRARSSPFLVDDIDISPELFNLVSKRVTPLLPRSLKIVDVITEYFRKRQLCLMITISSLGIVNRLMINYCKQNSIPIYLIINGFLANSFFDEAKEGTWINGYGDSIRKNYFKGMENIVCLGDPRMDAYAEHVKQRPAGSGKLTIGVGASGFTNVDLNCYLAIEFEFLNDVIKACRTLKLKGREIHLLIQVRSNGYIQQYRHFLEEYYPDMEVTLYQETPIRQIYKEIDFFISIYSQTLFEASCLGIPVLYYKNDTQNFHPPYNGKAELVTAFTVDELIEKIDAAFTGSKIYAAFQERGIMEKYIGPLDGKNLQRNMDFIESILSKENKGGQYRK